MLGSGARKLQIEPNVFHAVHRITFQANLRATLATTPRLLAFSCLLARFKLHMKSAVDAPRLMVICLSVIASTSPNRDNPPGHLCQSAKSPNRLAIHHKQSRRAPLSRCHILLPCVSVSFFLFPFLLARKSSMNDSAIVVNT